MEIVDRSVLLAPRSVREDPFSTAPRALPPLSLPSPPSPLLSTLSLAAAIPRLAEALVMAARLLPWSGLASLKFFRFVPFLAAAGGVREV